MFIHLLAGVLVFWLWAKLGGFEISSMYLLAGAFWGYFPDFLSYILKRQSIFNKWSHGHRNNISHSLVLPLVTLLAASIVGSEYFLVAALAMLTHPLLDLYGIGWGVKLLYPFSDKTYKLFYKGRWLVVWNQEEVDAEAEKYGDDDWVRNIYFRPSLTGTLEWLSLLLVIILLFVY